MRTAVRAGAADYSREPKTEGRQREWKKQRQLQQVQGMMAEGLMTEGTGGKVRAHR
jgi:hypothetical protein